MMYLADELHHVLVLLLVDVRVVREVDRPAQQELVDRPAEVEREAQVVAGTAVQQAQPHHVPDALVHPTHRSRNARVIACSCGRDSPQGLQL